MQCCIQAPGAGEARADNLVLHGLAVQLGPDLRVLYPMNVLNFGIAGELVANGPADPAHLKLAGTIRCAPLLLHDAPAGCGVCGVCAQEQPLGAGCRGCRNRPSLLSEAGGPDTALVIPSGV